MGSSGSGTVCGYTVEARTTFSEAQQHPSGWLIEREWKRVPIRVSRCDRSDHNHYQSGKIGEIPVFNYNHELDNLDLMNFDAAYALATQIMAQIWNGGCVQTRVVEVEVTYSYAAKDRSIGEPISLNGIRQEYQASKKPVTSTDGGGQKGTPAGASISGK